MRSTFVAHVEILHSPINWTCSLFHTVYTLSFNCQWKWCFHHWQWEVKSCFFVLPAIFNDLSPLSVLWWGNRQTGLFLQTKQLHHYPSSVTWKYKINCATKVEWESPDPSLLGVEVWPARLDWPPKNWRTYIASIFSCFENRSKVLNSIFLKRILRTKPVVTSTVWFNWHKCSSNPRMKKSCTVCSKVN